MSSSFPAGPRKRSGSDSVDRDLVENSNKKRQRLQKPASPSQHTKPFKPGRPSLSQNSQDSADQIDIRHQPPSKSPQPTRVLGPALPPIEDSDSSEDDFGPAPPPLPQSADHQASDQKILATQSAFDTEAQHVQVARKVQRDEWMTLPPTQDDLSRVDPTRMRARKFNTSKKADGTKSTAMGVWTETPQEKLKRLQEELLGSATPANSRADAKETKKSRKEEEQARVMREQIRSARGKALIEQHLDKLDANVEDDPSKRVFDYEKDMAIGTKISHKQKRELLDQAKGLSNRFSSGSYL